MNYFHSLRYKSRGGHALAAVFGLLLPVVIQAQWTSQTLTLHAGWNSVFLEVQPEPQDCDTVFASLPAAESVWRFNRRQTVVQFIADPTNLVPSQPDWLTWLPLTHPLASRSSLFLLEGGRPYLIKLAANAPTTTWIVRGKPVIRKPEWLADSLNFVGFPLPASNPPPFQRFFTNALALATNNIYRLSSSGSWTRLTTPGTTLMQPGEAFWIGSTGLSDFGGALEVEMDRRVGLDFGRILTELKLTIRNYSTNASRTASLRQMTSETPPATTQPALAGGVPLSYWQNDYANNRAGWTNLPAQLSSNLPPGGSWELRLAVRRADMAAMPPLPPGFTNALYQSLIEVTDTANSTRILVPVMAEGLQSSDPSGISSFASSRTETGSPAADPRAGLWMGTVSVTNVSQPSSANPGVPVPAASEFQYRVIVHLDAGGQARLLQRVLQMWKPGQTNSAGGVAVAGHYVLLTDDSLASPSTGYTGAAMRDGKLVGRRFSSAAFTFRRPQAMTGNGAFGADASVFRCSITNPYNDPLNPFVHRFHPDHNNLDDRGGPLTVQINASAGPYTAESWSVRRDLEFQFTAADPQNLSQGLSGWGDNQLGGIFRETIYGLHKIPLAVQGTFRLRQASSIAVLNDGVPGL